MQRLPFCLVSKAYSTGGRTGGRVQPIEGMRNLAAVAHKHGVPVTWIIHEDAAQALAGELGAWHDQYGDDVAVSLMRLNEDTATAYARRRAAIRTACPWSQVEVAGGGGGKSARMLANLAQAGFRGMWGYCWEQTYVDGITDYGQPPGLFYASTASYKMPAADDRGILAIEWLSRDLNKAFWTANPVNFATEPDAFLVMGDWDLETTFRYYAHVLEQYRRNAAAGQFLPLIFQEEAEQLMPGQINATYDAAWPRLLAWIDEALARMDWTTIECLTMPQLVDQYAARRPAGGQLVRAADDAFPPLKRPPHNFPIWGAELRFPEIAHFSDTRRFATFVAGNPAPIRLFRYDRQEEVAVSQSLQPETNLPRLLELRRAGAIWEARIAALEAMPYALALSLRPGERPPKTCMVNGDLAAWPIELEAGERVYRA